MDIQYIKDIVADLDWNSPKEIQENAIRELKKVDKRYVHLILDKTRKGTWKNAIKVVEQMDFIKKKELLPQLIWLLQDLNWPGSMEAVQILCTIEKELLSPLIEKTIIKAYGDKDYMWLGGINLLIKSAGYNKNDFYNQDVLELLQYADF